MKKIEILTLKLENQIEKSFDTLISIQEIEAKNWPARHLKDTHRTMLWFIHQAMLTSSLLDKFEWKWLTMEKILILVWKIWEATKEHYLELYGFDTKKIANS